METLLAIEKIIRNVAPEIKITRAAIEQMFLEAMQESGDDLSRALVKLAVKLADEITPEKSGNHEQRKKIGIALFEGISKEVDCKIMQAVVEYN